MGANVGSQPSPVRSASWEMGQSASEPLPVIEEEVHIKAKEEDPKKLDKESRAASKESQGAPSAALQLDGGINDLRSAVGDLARVCRKEEAEPNYQEEIERQKLECELTPAFEQVSDELVPKIASGRATNQEDPGISRLASACRRIGKFEDVGMRMEVAAQNLRKMEEVIADMRAVPNMEVPSDLGVQALEVSEKDTHEVDVIEEEPQEVTVMDSPMTEETTLLDAVDMDMISPRVKEPSSEMPGDCSYGALEAAMYIFTPPRPLSMCESPAEPVTLSAPPSYQPVAKSSAALLIRPRQRGTRTPIRRTSELVQGRSNTRQQPTQKSVTVRPPASATAQTPSSNGIPRLGQTRQPMPNKSVPVPARTPPAPNGGMRGRASMQLCVRMPTARSARAMSPTASRPLSPSRVAVLTPRVGSSPSRAPPLAMVKSVPLPRSATAPYSRVVKQGGEQDPAGFGEAAAAIERASELLEKVSQRKAPTTCISQPAYVHQALPFAAPRITSPSCSPMPVQGNVSLSSSLRLVSPPRVAAAVSVPMLSGAASPRSGSPAPQFGTAMPAPMLSGSASPRSACGMIEVSPPAGSFQTSVLRNAVTGAITAGAGAQVLTMSARAPVYMPSRPGSRSPSPGPAPVVRGMSVPAVTLTRQPSAIWQHGYFSPRSASPAPLCAARPGRETPKTGIE
mmetsp:Transcript_95561/g.183600  ORF Transcript_95561/g.183600 Transcript_95561/m.183600 type:complete len:681 (+) Transcript_95561:158-2200(+)